MIFIKLWELNTTAKKKKSIPEQSVPHYGTLNLTASSLVFLKIDLTGDILIKRPKTALTQTKECFNSSKLLGRRQREPLCLWWEFTQHGDWVCLGISAYCVGKMVTLHL